MISKNIIRKQRIQILANRLVKIAERRLIRVGIESPIKRNGSYEDRISSSRLFAAQVLIEWRKERPQTLRRLVWSDSI